MIRVSIMYPNEEGARFDMDYYMNTHIPLVQEKIGPALKGCTVERGLAGLEPGSPAPYLVMACLWLDSMDDLVACVAPHDQEFTEDVANFTNLVPIRQINEVIM